MVDIVSEVTYPLDPSGKAASNKIPVERHTLTSKRWSEFNIIIPHAAPFFELDALGQRLKLTHYPSGAILEHGKDWVPGWYFSSASGRIGKHIYGCIVMIDPTMGGEIEIDHYQTLGGEWTLNRQKLKELLAEKLENPLRRYWEVVMNLPSIFPPLDHPHPVDDLSGLPQMLQAINGISEAILQASTGGGLPEHLLDFANPHKVTAEQVKLGKVMNWAIATLADIQVGAMNGQTYMNPIMTYEMIRNVALTVITAHVNAQGNVHNSTAGQVGAYTKEEVVELINELLRGELGTINADLLEGENRDQILARAKTGYDAAIATSKQQIINELGAIVAQMEAQDTARFAGKTEDDWRLIISQAVDGAGNLMFHPKVQAEPASGNNPANPRTSPTYTLIATIQAAWEGNFKRDVATFEIAGGAAEADQQLQVFTGACNPDQPTQLRINTELGTAADISFVYRVNTQPTLPDGSTNPRYNLGELWMKAPVKRRAITVTCNSQESFQISDGGEILDQEDWVAQSGDVVITPTNRYKAHTDAITAIQQVDAQQTADINSLTQSLTFTNTNLSNLGQTVSLQGEAIASLGRREVQVVAQEVELQPDAFRDFNVAQLLNAALGAGASDAYDLEMLYIVVRMIDDESGSPTQGYLVDAAPSLSVANTSSGIVRLRNTVSQNLKFYVRISARRKAF